MDNSPVPSYKERIGAGLNTAQLIFGGLQGAAESEILGRLTFTPKAQGDLGEKVFGGNLNLFSKRFETFDNFENGIATSSKTINLDAPSYLSKPGSIATKLNGYLNEIADFTQATGGDFTLRSSMIQERQLGLLTIGYPNAAQYSALSLSTQHAESLGIQFTLKSTSSSLSDPIIKGLLASPKPTNSQSQSH